MDKEMVKLGSIQFNNINKRKFKKDVLFFDRKRNMWFGGITKKELYQNNCFVCQVWANEILKEYEVENVECQLPGKGKDKDSGIICHISKKTNAA